MGKVEIWASFDVKHVPSPAVRAGALWAAVAAAAAGVRVDFAHALIAVSITDHL